MNSASAPDARFEPGFRGSSRLRIGRWSEVGRHYFVTVKTEDRTPILSNPSAAGILMRTIRWEAQQGRWAWRCFVVMPDHLHLVFELKEESPIGVIVKSMKRYTALRINETLHRHGSVWQDGFFDHRIRTDEKMEQIAFYCARNPVKAGLALETGDWPYFRCDTGLRDTVQSKYEELLALERGGKSWLPPAGGEAD
jgi:putative transposase